jgi:nitronate monooxygenase
MRAERKMGKIGLDWSRLVLPVMAAPMFIVSTPALVIAACRAGVIGAFPAGNPRAPDTLETWLAAISEAEAHSLDRGETFAPFCVNLLAAAASDPAARRARLETCRRARVPLILTNLGDPRAEVAAAHDWGGIVLHDVTTLRFAEKAIAAGVDGLMLVCGGAGGHAGTLNPFAFLPQVRRMFGGLILLAGGIADGNGIAAALSLGADLVVMGTRFIATLESGALPAHKTMLVRAAAEDVLYTDAIAGLPASFLKPSMREAGLDPDNLPPPLGLHRPNLPRGVKAWKTIWSGGHSTGLIDDIPSVADLVTRLGQEFAAARAPAHWRSALARAGQSA